MNDEKIICALLSNPSVAGAAKSLDVTPQTIYNKLRDTDFRQRYAEARREVLEQDCYKLQSFVSDAVEQIHSILVDEMGTTTQIRLNACDMLLRHCYRMTELTDILTRLEAVENTLNEEGRQ